MSDDEKTGRQLAPYESAIKKSKERFHKVASQSVSYERESIFAMQALMKTDYAMKVANSNHESVLLAMINVASTGLTLNPANGYAYLVPRDNAIVLDISYKGLIKIATDAGSVVWARADLVYADDTFTYHGPARIPDHVADPFKKDRGELVGCYCIAKTKDGDFLTEVMSREDIETIRGKSQAWVKGAQGRKGPWEDFFGEMCRKSVIKRASKTWPYTDQSERLYEAVEVANQSEGGYNFEREKPPQIGRPNDGCRIEDMPEERQIVIRENAEVILEFAEAGQLDDACKAYDELTLPPEEVIALWGTLPSHHRSAIKRLQDKNRQAKRAA